MFESIFNGTLTLPLFIICLAVAAVLGLLTALVFLYKTKHTSSFALTLALLPMAVAMVIMLVNGNLGTGIAVAGTFALVRFRSLQGTAREISAIFTSVAIGLAVGMGCIGIAVIFFIFTAVLTLVLTKLNFGAPSRHIKNMKITIPEGFDYNGLFDDIFEKYGVKTRLEKIRTTNMGTLFELSYEAVFAGDSVPKEFIDEIRSRNGNLNVIIGDPSESEGL